MHLLSALQSRYSTKVFDPTKKLSDNQLFELTEALRLSASSYGLQPWKFLVITNPELRKTMQAHAWNQAQVTEASHLIAILSKTSVDAAYVDTYIDLIVKERGVDRSTLQHYRTMMLGAIAAKTPREVQEWSMRQAYIALGTLLTSAAVLGIDACPMEGFVREDIDTDLGLKNSGWTTTLLCPVGFRGDDVYATKKKVRFDRDIVIEQR